MGERRTANGERGMANGTRCMVQGERNRTSTLVCRLLFTIINFHLKALDLLGFYYLCPQLHVVIANSDD